MITRDLRPKEQCVLGLGAVNVLTAVALLAFGV